MGKASIQFYGFDELAKNFDKAKNELINAVEQSLEQSMQIPKKDMLDFVAQHKRTGRTYNSWRENITNNNNIIEVDFGFSIKDGGLPAIFLNLGGLRTKPYYFIDNAINNNIDKIKNTQIETIRKVLNNYVE